MDPQVTATFLDGVRHATASPNAESTIALAFEHIGRQDFEAFGTLLAADIVLEIRGMPAINGTWRGRDEVVSAVRENFTRLTDQKPELEGMICDAGQAALSFRETGVIKADNTHYAVYSVYWITTDAGRITSIREVIAPACA